MAGAMRKMGIYLGLVEDDERRTDVGDYDEYDDYTEEPEVVPVRREHRPVRPWDETPSLHPQPSFVEEPAPKSYRITTFHPRSYNEARTIGEQFREGVPVILNLTEMDDNDAKRLVDFAAGLIFGLRGSIDRVTAKVFLLSPQDVEVTAEDKAAIAEGGFFNQS